VARETAAESESLRAIFDPCGPAKLCAANYVPIHLLFTALEREIFADTPFAYHLVIGNPGRCLRISVAGLVDSASPLRAREIGEERAHFRFRLGPSPVSVTGRLRELACAD
jgi:hypothetical protein